MTTHQKITQSLLALTPTYLQLDNESHNHAGYYDGKESHFKLTIVSDDFVGKRLILRHQMIYALVAPLLIANGGTIHALAIHAYTPDEWQTTTAPDSPRCAGR